MPETQVSTDSPSSPAPPKSWNRPLLALWIANFIASIGMMAMVPFLTLFVEELGTLDRAGGERWAGVLVGAAPLCAALMGPVWGGVGDRFGRRNMLIRALLAITLFVGSMAFARSLGAMLMLRILQGCFSGFVAPSLTLASLIVPREQQTWAAARIQSATPAGAVAGYLMGGHVSDLGSVRWIFPICSVLAATAALLVFLLVPEPKSGRRGGGRRPIDVIRGIAQDFGEVVRIRPLARFLTLLVTVRVLVSLVDPNLARFVRDDLRGSGDDAGLALAAESAMLLIFMPRWGRRADRVGPRRTFSLAAFGVAVAFLAQSFVTSVWALVACRAVNGVFLAAIFPSGYGLAARESSVEQRGAAIGVVFLSIALSHALGAMVGGAVLNFLGFRSLFLTVGTTLFIVAALGLIESRASRLRRQVDAKRNGSAASSTGTSRR